MMKYFIFLLSLIVVSHATLPYPETRKVECVDEYHGVLVEDPYRHLEDQSSEETRGWIDVQNSYTQQYLAGIDKRETIRGRLTELFDYERIEYFFKCDGRIYFSKKNGLQNQAVVYVTESLDAEPRVLIDPNLLSQEGTVACTETAVDYSGKYIAYMLASLGSDWSEIRVKEVADGKDLEDVVSWLKFSQIVWHPSQDGFFYLGMERPTLGNDYVEVVGRQKIFFHQLGTKQDDDKVVFEMKDRPHVYFRIMMSSDDRYLMIAAHEGCSYNSEIYYLELGQEVKPLCTQSDVEYRFVGNLESLFWFLTNKDAPNRKVVAIDLEGNLKEVIPEKQEVIENIALIADRFVVEYIKDARSVLKVYLLDGSFEKEIPLPTSGSIMQLSGDMNDREMYYSFTNYTTPVTVYKYNFDTNETTLIFKPAYPADLDLYETKQVFYPSKDGTMIPMSLSYKKGTQFDESTPIYLYAYGGFGISETPSFGPSSFSWIERGGVFAVANIRGGGEYGEAWHKSATMLNRQNAFDDFIKAAEWLISNKMTSKNKLAIAGASNGGLLVGACMTQRPDLYGAVVAAVGVMDMLRFQKFTVGWGWIPEYGSSDNCEQFSYLYKYSPLHNLRQGVSYPATIILTGDHDDRVVPSHSYKFAATLQEVNANKTPVLLRIDKDAGHGGAKPTSKIIEEQADKWAFICNELGC